MSLGLLGRKVGMMRIFTDDGDAVPVTVLDVSNNRVAQIKTVESDGYTSVQLAHGGRRASRVTKAQAGHFAKANVAAGRGVWEFRLAGEEAANLQVGGELTVELFAVGQAVDVIGQSKGKGFQGGVKRWNFRTQDATHGNSVSHRVHGSTGQNQSPGKVFKGKKMAGHMGDERVTIQGLEIVSVDAERNVLVVKGAVPGATGYDVIVRPSVKA